MKTGENAVIMYRQHGHGKVESTTTIRQQHEDRLASLLQRQLWLQDYSAVAATLDALIACESSIAHGGSEWTYSVVLELLQRDPAHYRQCVRMFRTILGKGLVPPQAVLLEFTCYLMGRGHLQEAFDNLTGFVDRHPFKYNSVVHGYYGMLADALNRNLQNQPGCAVCCAVCYYIYFHHVQRASCRLL